MLLTTGGAPALILRPGNSCVDKCFGGAQWAKDLRDLHLGVTFQRRSRPRRFLPGPWCVPAPWSTRPRARTASTARSRTSSTSPSRAPHSSTSRRPGVPRRRRGVGQEKSRLKAARQQGPGRVQGRRRDVLLPALHDDARRLPLRLSIQLTPRRGRARRPNGQPREKRRQRVDDQAIRRAVERVVVAAVW